MQMPKHRTLGLRDIFLKGILRSLQKVDIKRYKKSERVMEASFSVFSSTSPLCNVLVIFFSTKKHPRSDVSNKLEEGFVVVVVDNVVGAAVCSQKSESKKTLRLSHSIGLHRDEKQSKSSVDLITSKVTGILITRRFFDGHFM